MTTQPNSILTRERPDIWRGALSLASSLTLYEYAPKLPLADGTIYACGGYTPPTREEQESDERRERIRDGTATDEDVAKRIEELEEKIRSGVSGRWFDQFNREEIEALKKRLLKTSARVFVPEGGMEWLLHEVGHFVAATPEERALPNYGLTADIHGHDGDREWQAWAFEEIVLAPFGPARLFVAPTQRDGAAFTKTGPMPAAALHHVERQILALGLDVERWRVVWAEWIRWGAGKPAGRRPWETSQ